MAILIANYINNHIWQFMIEFLLMTLFFFFIEDSHDSINRYYSMPWLSDREHLYLRSLRLKWLATAIGVAMIVLAVFFIL